MSNDITTKFKLTAKVVIHRNDGSTEEIELPCEVVEQPEVEDEDGERTDERG